MVRWQFECELIEVEADDEDGAVECVQSELADIANSPAVISNSLERMEE